MPRRRRAPWWEDLTDEDLLDVRLCDLGLRIEGSELEDRLLRLHAELARVGLRRFRPYAWLSTSWFTPHGCTGFAVPFYLAHQRLIRIERWQIGEAEGASREGCLRLMRHETAHCLDHAYRLHRRGPWRATFGPFSKPYRASYVPKPGSRHFVVNLDYWYAQSHPGEDWAETFAVWLRPGSRWRSRYRGWPALRKLQYVEALAAELANQPPPVRTRERVDALPELHHSLREHYRRKRSRWERVLRRGKREYLR
jgi:hypothetical protein